MKILNHALGVLALGASLVAHASSLTNLLSFQEETKIKGGFLVISDRLYFACEKGGQNGFGYIGVFDPTKAALEPLHHFTTDAKPKGGLVHADNAFYFLAEKGSSTTGFGWIGRLDAAANTLTEVHAYSSDIKPKSGFATVGDKLYFATERGGAENLGSIEAYTVGQSVTNVVSLSATLGIKIESWAVDGATVYYGAREGGDPTQLAGKGAGAIGRIDVRSGQVTKLIDLNNEDHGAKLRGLTLHNGRLWFVLEEGGNLALNSGKGGGAIGSFDLNTREIVGHHSFSGPEVWKPRTLVVMGGEVYVATERGGSADLGVFGVLRNGNAFEVINEFSAELGAKPNHYATLVGNRIYFTTELGTAGFLGGIAAFDAGGPAAIPELAIARRGDNVSISWRQNGTAIYTLQAAGELGGPEWETVSEPAVSMEDVNRVEIPMTSGRRFFRLKQ